MGMENDGGMILTRENRKTRRKICPSASLTTTNITWIYPDANPGLRGERPATNRLSHGMALWQLCYLHTVLVPVRTVLRWAVALPSSQRS
jgi:hypothetical protein